MFTPNVVATTTHSNPNRWLSMLTSQPAANQRPDRALVVASIATAIHGHSCEPSPPPPQRPGPAGRRRQSRARRHAKLLNATPGASPPRARQHREHVPRNRISPRSQRRGETTRATKEMVFSDADCINGSGPRPDYPQHQSNHSDRLGIALPDGKMISVKVPLRPTDNARSGRPMHLTALFAVHQRPPCSGLWAAHALTAPLSSFAKAAENFSLNGAAEPLPERGPEEIRSVASALNRMRRAHPHIDRRPAPKCSPPSATICARRSPACACAPNSSRTKPLPPPLPAARSRPDAIDAGSRAVLPAQRPQARRHDAHRHRNHPATGNRPIRRHAHKVTYHGPSNTPWPGARPDDLACAVTNLVENAVKPGGPTKICLTMSEDGATIDVSDDVCISTRRKPRCCSLSCAAMMPATWITKLPASASAFPLRAP